MRDGEEAGRTDEKVKIRAEKERRESRREKIEIK